MIAPTIDELKQLASFAHAEAINGLDDEMGDLSCHVKEWISDLEALQDKPFDTIKLAFAAANAQEKHFEHIWVIATSHVSKETAGALDADSINGLVVHGHGEYGWMINTVNLDFEELAQGNTPVELFAAVKACVDRHCDWLLLDRDADQVETLSTFDWCS